MKLDLDTLGLTTSNTAELDADPTTKEEFSAYADAISKKITRLKGKEEYVFLIDELVKSLCAGCKSTYLVLIDLVLSKTSIHSQWHLQTLGKSKQP